MPSQWLVAGTDDHCKRSNSENTPTPLKTTGVRAGRCHDGQHYPLAALKQLLAPEGALQRVHK